MKQLIGIVSSLSLGGTFLDWSLHFLSGKNYYYNVFQSQWTLLTQDPLTEINAHGHNKNHPVGLAKTKETMDVLQARPDGMYSFYAGLIQPDVVASNLDIDVHNLSNDQYKLIVNEQRKNFQEQWQYCCEHTDSAVFVSLPKDAVLYKFFNRSLDRMPFENRPAANAEEIRNQFDQIFFAQSKKDWEANDLTEIWDLRERLALCLRPFDLQHTYIDQVDFSTPHLAINSTDLWHNGIDVVQQVMAFCKLDIVPERFEKWKLVYKKWQTIQEPVLNFVYHYQDMVDAIVTNKNYELPSLTFDQEVILQHCLIYQHALNLKTWQLSKFPTNAQDLHKLLEPNIHTV
jgi:hypothetical protein